MNVTRRRFLTAASATVLPMVTVSACAASAMSSPSDTHFAVTHTDAEWRRLLTAAQYSVLREAGTEAPYSSRLNDNTVTACSVALAARYTCTPRIPSSTAAPAGPSFMGDPGQRPRPARPRLDAAT